MADIHDTLLVPSGHGSYCSVAEVAATTDTEENNHSNSSSNGNGNDVSMSKGDDRFMSISEFLERNEHLAKSASRSKRSKRGLGLGHGGKGRSSSDSPGDNGDAENDDDDDNVAADASTPAAIAATNIGALSSLHELCQRRGYGKPEFDIRQITAWGGPNGTSLFDGTLKVAGRKFSIRAEGENRDRDDDMDDSRDAATVVAAAAAAAAANNENDVIGAGAPSKKHVKALLAAKAMETLEGLPDDESGKASSVNWVGKLIEYLNTLPMALRNADSQEYTTGANGSLSFACTVTLPSVPDHVFGSQTALYTSKKAAKTAAAKHAIEHLVSTGALEADGSVIKKPKGPEPGPPGAKLDRDSPLFALGGSGDTNSFASRAASLALELGLSPPQYVMERSAGQQRGGSMFDCHAVLQGRAAGAVRAVFGRKNAHEQTARELVKLLEREKAVRLADLGGGPVADMKTNMAVRGKGAAAAAAVAEGGGVAGGGGVRGGVDVIDDRSDPMVFV